MTKISLDFKERLALVNQYRILEKLDSLEAEAYRRAIEILEQGYEFDYHCLDGRIDPKVVPAALSKEVYEILEMYRKLSNGFQCLPDKSGIDPEDIKFPGFDGNNEVSHLSYCKFLNSERKYEESPAINSHMPTLDIYRRMLGAFKAVKAEGALSKADIQRVIAERVHPSGAEPDAS